MVIPLMIFMTPFEGEVLLCYYDVYAEGEGNMTAGRTTAARRRKEKNKMKILRRFIDTFLSPQLEFRVRLFNVLAMAGMAASFFIGFSRLITDQDVVVILIDWASAALAFGLMYYAARTQKYVRCYFITIFVIFLGLFPYLHFIMGGYRGGMSFFLFAIVFTVFMLEKKAAYIIVSLELFVYLGCMVISFIYPGLVTNFTDETGLFIHNLVTFLASAASLAIIALAHFRLYNEQQRRLDEQNAMLTQSNKAKTEFLSNASHEMRTPLTVTSVNVQTVLEILEDMGEKVDDPEAGALLKSAQKEIMRLSRMVGGMLTLASMSENTDRQKLDFSALMQSNIEMLRLNIGQNGNTIEADIERGLVVFGNADFLAQVLTNTMQNAGVHTKNGTVAVSAKQRGNEITVTVRDTGTGISPELLPRVFERGVSTGGTGYGLYLCKTAVESHGGRIWAESEVGKGTAVYYTLPVYEGQFGGAEE
jgi:signal transduction histidine kinase